MQDSGIEASGGQGASPLDPLLFSSKLKFYPKDADKGADLEPFREQDAP